MVIIALDGLTRQLAYCNINRREPEDVADTVCRMIKGKQTRNEAREWPDHRTSDQDKAIEHVRD